MIGGLQHQRELEAQIAETVDTIQRTDMKSWLPLLLLEWAGLARLRGDADDTTGWDDYARSIEA